MRPDKDAQPARTDFRRLAEAELPFESRRHPTSRYSLANASPLNGRRHQIRRHFKHIFHPILGDVRYGDGEHNRLFRQELGVGRMLLHAAEMTFPHPQSGVELSVVAPLDDAFRRLLENLGWIEKIPADLVQGLAAL